jgi:hypothetical protein
MRSLYPANLRGFCVFGGLGSAASALLVTFASGAAYGAIPADLRRSPASRRCVGNGAFAEAVEPLHL